jgi:phage-related tail protein
MLNFGVRREAVQKLEDAVKQHKDTRKRVENASVELLKQRQRAAGEVIETVESFVNELANSPKELKKTVAEYRVKTNRFEDTVREFESETVKVQTVGSVAATTGGIAGVAVATFGPTAAMAVATTFGTASTGTAISALSGAAATNAALAWLGGGALAAGGGGMAAGNALLAMAGPIGWTIGGVAIVGTGAFVHYRNGKIAQGATEARVSVEGEVLSLRVAEREIGELRDETCRNSEACLSDLQWLKANVPNDYWSFSIQDKERLGTLINHIRSLGELISKEVSL